MNRSKIEWVLNTDNKTLGWTWNPITGCLNHVKGLCKGGGFPCYAYKLAHGRLKQRYLANDEIANPVVCSRRDDIEEEAMEILSEPFYPRFWPERLQQPKHGQIGAGIFCCDMGELFGSWVPQEWQDKIFDVIKYCSDSRFYLLTKQPQNLIKWSPFPENCWVGVTATDTYMAVKGLQQLDNIKASKKFVSFEPLLSQTCMTETSLSGIDWLIIGAQTKPYKPPAIEHVEEIIDAADKAGIPVFEKNNLLPIIPSRKPFGNWQEVIKDGGISEFQLRQEMPL
jgi:protein gp37